MPRIGIQDRALFTVTELELIHSSFPSSLKTFSRGRVKAQISRTRKYSEKYRNLAREQHRAKKKSGNGAAQPGSNVRTERKAQIFTDTLHRFEKRLGQLKLQEQRKNTGKVKSPQSKPFHPPGKRTRNPEKKQQRYGVQESAIESRATRQIQKSQKPAIHGHIRARGKRRQAKRDSR